MSRIFRSGLVFHLAKLKTGDTIRYDASGIPSSSTKWRNLSLLALAELLAMSLWFSASAVVPQLTDELGLVAREQSWMTMGVQVGFVVGALLSAMVNLSDRVKPSTLIATSALLGSIFNAGVVVFASNVTTIIFLRFLTGVTMAGIYPPGMKLVATWAKSDRGLGIGFLVGAITMGSGVPHLLNAFPIFGDGGMPPWRPVLFASSVMGGLGALIAATAIQSGPFLSANAPFDWRRAGDALRFRPVRLANFGYLGHMWELYAMWTWVPLLLIVSYERAGLDIALARLAGFGVLAAGAAGSVIAGAVADRLGRTRIAIWSLGISGLCCLVVGYFIAWPAVLTVISLVWGFAVVADSAQFSAGVSELSDQRYVGTALTIQTSMGFLLTLVTIRLIPMLVDVVGWERVFGVLAIGPVFGIWSMVRLRRLPEAARMASGNR